MVERPSSANQRIKEKLTECALTKADRRWREEAEKSKQEWAEKVLDEHEKTSQRSRKSS